MDANDIALTKFQLQVLRMVAMGKGKNKWNWHDVAISVVPIPGEPEQNTMKALKSLESLGLVSSALVPYPTHDKWDVTPKGETVLKTHEHIDLW